LCKDGNAVPHDHPPAGPLSSGSASAASRGKPATIRDPASVSTATGKQNPSLLQTEIAHVPLKSTRRPAALRWKQLAAGPASMRWFLRTSVFNMHRL